MTAAQSQAGNGFRQLSADVRGRAVKALRAAAVEVLNDLSAQGPDWSGDFKNNWHARDANGEGGARRSTSSGSYNLFNIPRLKVEARSPGGRFAYALPPGKELSIFIGNSSPYAMEAMDLIPGRFRYPGFEPKGEVFAKGLRHGLRGDVRGAGSDRSTAPLHWFTTYMEGGGFADAIKRGTKKGFQA